MKCRLGSLLLVLPLLALLRSVPPSRPSCALTAPAPQRWLAAKASSEGVEPASSLSREDAAPAWDDSEDALAPGAGPSFSHRSDPFAAILSPACAWAGQPPESRALSPPL